MSSPQRGEGHRDQNISAGESGADVDPNGPPKSRSVGDGAPVMEASIEEGEDLLVVEFWWDGPHESVPRSSAKVDPEIDWRERREQSD